MLTYSSSCYYYHSTPNVSAEVLGENCADGNNQFFAAVSAKTKGMSQLHLWSNIYPLGRYTIMHTYKTYTMHVYKHPYNLPSFQSLL